MFEKKLGEIRPNQFITTYGPGSIMDAVHDSLTVLDIEYWNANNIGQEIRDSRLASFMNVRHFYMPSTKGKENIPVASFPYTHVCTNDRCKRLFDIREELKNPNYLENYKQHQGSASCPDCHYSAYPARFISICEDGHMDDFPWRWWCHNGKTNCKDKLRLKSFGTTSSLAELEVECDCGAKRRMSGSMQKENFEGCNCTGNHPQRPNAIKKICKKKIVPSQRGASNVYFPVTRTAISIPPWTNPINDLMAEHRRDIDLLIEVLGRDDGLNKSYEKYFEGKFTRDEFNEAYNRLEQNIKDYVELKEMEYNAITHHQQVEFQHDVRYFKAEEVAIKDSLKKYFSRACLKNI